MVYYCSTQCVYAWFGIGHWLVYNSERQSYGQKIDERGLESMARKGELSKTARASMANREDVNHVTSRICAKCGEAIMLKDLQPVKVLGKGMVYFHRSHYSMQ
jgi:hypothetical protein